MGELTQTDLIVGPETSRLLRVGPKAPRPTPTLGSDARAWIRHRHPTSPW
nr:hypothetical protein Itr_chr04CG19720 [Ipomoea trifida]